MMAQIKELNNDKIQFVNMIKKMLYNTAALGGSFDHLHDGHKDFILFAASISKSLIIGVTDQHMVLKKPFSELIQPTHVRKQAVLNFCNQHEIKAKLITLNDPFGPTIEENTIEAVICTTDTLPGANKINEIRNKLHLKELPIHVHQLKKDKEGIATISAERIRTGEIDRVGNVYASNFKTDLQLTETMREFFAKLHGTILTNPTEPQIKDAIKIVVGDSTLETFIQNNWNYTLGIFDKKRQRKEFASAVLDSLDTISVTNKAGWIQTEAVEVLRSYLENKNRKHIFVNGEEDLLAVIAILLLPLGSYVYYGQPKQGMVECVVSEKIKELFFEALTEE